eukprot:119216-Chlamydomonas_euryale.AAC.3
MAATAIQALAANDGNGYGEQHLGGRGETGACWWSLLHRHPQQHILNKPRALQPRNAVPIHAIKSVLMGQKLWVKLAVVLVTVSQSQGFKEQTNKGMPVLSTARRRGSGSGRPCACGLVCMLGRQRLHAGAPASQHCCLNVASQTHHHFLRPQGRFKTQKGSGPLGCNRGVVAMQPSIVVLLRSGTNWLQWGYAFVQRDEQSDVNRLSQRC